MSPTLINTIAKDKDLKEFIKLRINDEMYISKSENNLLVKRFDEDFYIDVLTITDGEYDFDKKGITLKESFNSENLISQNLFMPLEKKHKYQILS